MEKDAQKIYERVCRMMADCAGEGALSGSDGRKSWDENRERTLGAILEELLREHVPSEVKELLRKRRRSREEERQLNSYAFGVLCEAMELSLQGMRLPPMYRQKRWATYMEWLSLMAERYGIEKPEKYLEDLPKPVDDLNLAVVKALHDPEGVTKQELADRCHVDKKSIQTIIHSLDPQGEKNKNAKVLRFGGQRMQVKVESEERTDPGSGSNYRYTYFHTPNTLHPVALQMNVYQVMTLLTGLARMYEEGQATSIGIAMDIWSQISEYGKERVRLASAVRFPELSEFLDFLEEEAEEEYVVTYQTEAEMAKNDRMPTIEKLDIAYKSGDRVTVIYKRSSGKAPLKNCRIIMDRKPGEGCYHAVTEKGEEIPLVLADIRSVQ